jgi:uncharacterized membrane protein
MAPLVVLLLFTAIARILGWLWIPPLNSWGPSIAIGLAVMLLMTSLTHFFQPRRRGMIAIVPPRFPRPDVVVTITGILELLGAVGLLVPETRVAAAIGIGLLLIAMFPANVYASRELRHPAAPNTPLGIRSVMQLVFLIACALVTVLA